ncbi:unnamed protein product, partial [Choristocarpus tenellus]
VCKNGSTVLLDKRRGMNVLRGAKNYVTGALGLGTSGETSGALDVMVVQHEDGAMCCTPFHVRFAKIHPMNSKERVIQLRVNGRTVSLCMKLGAAGEAFFVERVHNPLRRDLVTSPLSSPLHGEEPKEWDSPSHAWPEDGGGDPWRNYQLLSDLSSDDDEGPVRYSRHGLPGHSAFAPSPDIRESNGSVGRGGEWGGLEAATLEGEAEADTEVDGEGTGFGDRRKAGYIESEERSQHRGSGFG